MSLGPVVTFDILSQVSSENDVFETEENCLENVIDPQVGNQQEEAKLEQAQIKQIDKISFIKPPEESGEIKKYESVHFIKEDLSDEIVKGLVKKNFLSNLVKINSGDYLTNFKSNVSVKPTDMPDLSGFHFEMKKVSHFKLTLVLDLDETLIKCFRA